MRALLVLVLAGLALGPRAAGGQGVGSLELLGLATVPPGSRFADTEIGGLSGITYDARLDRYYAISDDPSRRSPARFYTLRIGLDSGRPELEIEGVTLLADRRGRPFAEWVIDGEGIALTPRRTLLVSSEGSIERGVPPSIREFDLDGRELREYRIPKRYLARKRKPRGLRHNAAFESLAVTADGQGFVTAGETALHQDGPEADVGRGSRTRISRFDSRSGRPESEVVYEIEPVVAPPEPAGEFRTNGLVELIALDGSSLLALERSFSVGVGNSIRLYLVSTARADDVRRLGGLERRTGITPASKRLLVDFADLGLVIDNVEGMTFGPALADGRRSLVLISDDNFSDRQTTQLLAFAVDSRPTPPPAIQGSAHRSPLEGRWVAEARGVVTALDLEGRRPGFWMQDAAGDGDPATADAVFVSTAVLGAGRGPVEAGQLVSVAGRVTESGWPGELPVTRLVASHVEVLQRHATLPPAVRVGGDGRRVPATVDDDALGSFDPGEDAIDFYESLEGMRLEIAAATVTGPTTEYGTLVLALDGGDGARTARGGLLLGAADPNTERLTVDGSLIGGIGDLEVGRRLAAPLTGVLDYAFGGYRLMAAEEPRVTAPEPRAPNDAAFARRLDWLRVATYNVWNLDPGDGDDRFSALGGQLEHWWPDIVALQEIQDDSGAVDDGTVTAAATLGKLVAAVGEREGLRYEYLQLDPENNADGGAPGGNIRVAFLYDASRVRLVREGSRLGGTNPVRLFGSSPAFQADAETGFEATRKPLAAEFELDGRRLVVINVHLKSKRGDDPIFGARQPPVRRTEPQRIAQARELGSYVAALLADDPEALVMVLGDFNEHEFRPPLRVLEAHGLVNLLERAGDAERYTYNFEGNSQALDHILVSPALAACATEIDLSQRNSDLPHAWRASDHDPVLASFDLRQRPVE